MPNTFTILFSIIVAVSVLTWIIPSGKYVDGIYQTTESHPQGLWNIIASPVQGFFDAKDVILYVLILGGFLNIVIKTGSMDAFIGWLLKKLKGHEYLLILTLFTLFSFAGNGYGMGEETIGFYSLLLPVFIRAGYDPVTVVLVLLVGSNVGIVGSMFNPFSVGIASSLVGLNLAKGMLVRFIIYLASAGTALSFTLWYASRVKKDYMKYSIVADLKEEHDKAFKSSTVQAPEFTRKRRVTLSLYLLTFATLIIGVVPWGSKWGIHLFERFNDFLAKWSFFGIQATTSPNYLKIETSSAAFGDWWFGQICVLFFFSAIFIGKLAGMKQDELIENFMEGAKNFLPVSLIIAVARGIKIIMENGAINDTILYYGSLFAEHFNSVGSLISIYFLYFPIGLLIPSTSAAAAATIPILGPLGDALNIGAHNVISAYQSAHGMIQFIAPTSAIVMGGLMLAKVPYIRFLKLMLPLIAVLSIISIVILSIAVVIKV